MLVSVYLSDFNFAVLVVVVGLHEALPQLLQVLVRHLDKRYLISLLLGLERIL